VSRNETASGPFTGTNMLDEEMKAVRTETQTKQQEVAAS
jgi:hypothetical protein